jgi:hypothetical protein
MPAGISLLHGGHLAAALNHSDTVHLPRVARALPTAIWHAALHSFKVLLLRGHLAAAVAATRH